MKKSTGVAGLTVMSVMVLAACGHDHYYDNGGVDPSGVYEGTLTDDLTQQTTAVTGILDENGDGILGTQNGQYYRLSNINTSDYNVVANFTAFSNSGNFASGSTTTTGTISGSYTQPGLHLSYKAQGNDTGTLSLNYDNVYNNPSSLPTLAGNFSQTSNGLTLTLAIQSNGSFTGSDSSGCTYSGFFQLIYPEFNAYSESYNLTCAGTTTAYSGLADYVPASAGSSTPPAEIMLLADDGNGHFLDATLQKQQ